MHIVHIIATVPQSYYSLTFALQSERKHFQETITSLKRLYRVHFGKNNYSGPCWLSIWVPLTGIVFWCPKPFGCWLLIDRAKLALFSKALPLADMIRFPQKLLSTPAPPCGQMKHNPHPSKCDVCAVLCSQLLVSENNVAPHQRPHLCWNSYPCLSWLTLFPVDFPSRYI